MLALRLALQCLFTSSLCNRKDIRTHPPPTNPPPNPHHLPPRSSSNRITPPEDRNTVAISLRNIVITLSCMNYVSSQTTYYLCAPVWLIRPIPFVHHWSLIVGGGGRGWWCPRVVKLIQCARCNRPTGSRPHMEVKGSDLANPSSSLHPST